MQPDDLTFCICTRDSSGNLRDCLESIRHASPSSRIVVVDHHSTDATPDIARKFGANIFLENRGLGYARQLCFDVTTSEYLVFVDADVEITRRDFFQIARGILSNKKFGAVVGLAGGHRFAYGLPASLLMLRKRDFTGGVIPDYVDGRETHFIQRRLDALRLRTYYVYDSISHHSAHRRFMPEYQGAYTRLLPSPAIKEISFSFKVITLRALNSRNAKNILYVPIFCAKFLRGFANPQRWVRKGNSRGA